VCGQPEFRLRIVRDVLGRLVGQQQLDHHAARGLGAVGLRLDFHAGRRRADAARCKHALAFDLHHADAAVPIGAIAGLGQVAQVRELDVEAARGTKDRLAGADVDFAAVDAEGVGFPAWVCVHRLTISLRPHRPRRGLHPLLRRKHPYHQLPSGFSSSSGKYLNTLSSGLGAAWPRPQMEASRIASDSSVNNALSQGPVAISLTAFSVPARQGVHCPQLSSSKKRIRLSATAFISSLSDRITTACDPTKQPYFSKVPKSSGSSAIEAGRIPPEAPPGR